MNTLATSAAMSDKEAVYRKLITRLIPFLFLSYVVNQLDRVNISFAKLRFMQDVGLNDLAYGLGAGLFFIGYVAFEVPSNLYLQKAGARATFIRIMVLWGSISAAMALVSTPLQLYIARFLLGAAEAGFVPGVILYLTYWFPSNYRARITALFFMAIAFSGMIGGPVSGLILKYSADWGVMKDWQWLFVVEGLPAVALGVMGYFYLDNRPEEARWLSPQEKSIVRADLAAESKPRQDAAQGMWRAIAFNPKVYVAGLIYFSIIAGNNAITLWMPQIVKDLGFKDVLTIGMLSGIPYVVGALAMFLVSRHSDKTLERRWHVAIPLLFTASSYALLGHFNAYPAISIVLLSIAAAGLFSAFGIFWTIPPAYLTGKLAAGGIALVSSMGMFGGFFSPLIIGWAKSATGQLQYGFWAIAAVLVIGVALQLLAIPASLLTQGKKSF